jgi:trigger factor
MRLALEAVAREENFEVTDEDISAEIDRMAEQYSMDADTIRNMISAAEIRSDIKTTKALDFIKENAKVTKPKKTTAKKTTKKAKETAEEAPAEEKPAEETEPADAE